MYLYWLTIITLGIISSHTYADDTEIYLGTANRVKPNALFVIDTSGSMAICTGSGTKLTDDSNQLIPYQQKKCTDNGRSDRASLVRQSVSNVINSLSGINLGLMRFDDSSNRAQGGFVIFPISDMDKEDNKNAALSIISGYRANRGLPHGNEVTSMGVGGNGTSLVETIHEAALYLRGEDVTYGNMSGRKSNHDTYRWYASSTTNVTYSAETTSNSVSDPSIINNGKYISPVIDQCQKNHIVIFTDGASSNDSNSDSWIQGKYKNLPDRPVNGTDNLSTNCSTSDSDSCLEELAYYLYNTDNASSIDGVQKIQIHTIGGFIKGDTQTILDRAATHGGGISANAQNYADLENALTKIFEDIIRSAGTFSAPAVAVNAFNSLEQLDQLYYSVFKPHEAVGWSGNVKRFRMTTDGTIVDSKGNSAVDPTNGFFNKNAQSFWTQDADAPDGDNVVKGGIASRLPLDRKVVTNIAGNNLNASNNRIHEDNTSLNRTLMGTSLSGSEYTKLIQWARGLDVKASSASNPRRAMEDPLHSRPVLLNYGQTTDASGKKIPDSTLFIGTNSGYLHAFDTNADSPKERFAFIPKELLPVVTAYYQGGGVKKYGLDGPISVWHDDTNRDQIINNSEKAYLYIGMRRGGSSYYAIDVSNRDAPKVLWQINGRDHPNTTSGFERLGQTWSRMAPVDVTWTDGNKRKVLIFGGGYDPKEDNYAVRTTHEQGNAIYMVDAKTGSLLWSTSSDSAASLRLTGMKSGIVGNIVAVDDDSDGDVDILYAADLGGRLWRIDFLPGASSSNRFAQGGLIADLGVNNSRANNVRFFTSPDVVYSEYGVVWQTDASTGKTVSVEGKGRYQIALGSGYRAHPLNEDANDFFYVVNDYAVDGAPESYLGFKKADLANYNNYDNASYTLKNNGLYYDLPGTGEKVLSNSVTLADTIYFTTYQPVDPASRSGCEADTGKAKLYKIKPTYEDRRTIEQKDLVQPGIVSEPVVIKPPLKEDGDGDSSMSLLIGAEIEKIKLLGNPLRKTYWREQEQ